jgi:ParB-like chromosome segregation protein Spo0J
MFTHNQQIIDSLIELLPQIEALSLDEKVETLNEIKRQIHKVSPFNTEPVDCVIWVNNESIHANDYNPNSVAPPEMKLLEHSISEDGFTQPIVTMYEETGEREVIDGFHRNRVGKESDIVSERVKGFLPVVSINQSRQEKGDRIASTIRHNRARGKHKVDAMSDIVVDLKRRNWSDKKIATELGMDQDEVLRLCQISGLAEMFADQEFSTAWEAVEMDGNFEDIPSDE